MKSGIEHIVSAVPVLRSQYESEEHHALIHGTSFPVLPVEKQLFYRDDLHTWYIYNGTAWVSLQAAAIDHLNDIGDVSVASPTGGYVVYWDNSASLWKAKKVDGSNLSQTFGASATRLRNIIPTPIAGEILRIANCGGSCFAGVIDNTPAAHGGQGLDATHVPYDGDTYEDMFKGLFTYDGAAYWGQIILHNITRGNSRKIVSVDRTNNVIVTSSSTDNWADNDVLTTESRTNGGSGTQEFFDIDISDKVGTGVDAIYLWVAFGNNTATADAENTIYIHPYEAFNAGKRLWITASLGYQKPTGLLLVPVISQKITACAWKSGVNDNYIVLSVSGTVEFADT